MNVNKGEIHTMIERLQALHAIKGMHNVCGIIVGKSVADQLMNRVGIIGDQHFRLSKDISSPSVSTHLPRQNTRRRHLFAGRERRKEFLANYCLDFLAQF